MVESTTGWMCHKRVRPPTLFLSPEANPYVQSFNQQMLIESLGSFDIPSLGTEGPSFLRAAGILEGVNWQQTGDERGREGTHHWGQGQAVRRVHAEAYADEEVNCWFFSLCISGAFVNNTFAHEIIRSKLSCLVFCSISQSFILL